KTRIVEVIKKQANNYFIAVVSLTVKEEIDLKEIILPDQDLEVLRKEHKAVESKIFSIDNLLREGASYKKGLSKYLNYLKKSLDFNRVKSSMQEEGEIAYLQGFMPAEEVAKLIALANKKGWAYLIQQPDNLQEVPTFIKNPRWLRIIEPVFKFMGTLPGYNEYDISFSFLLFFSLFFALLIGDGGYGLIFLLITYLVRRKVPTLPPEPFRLIYVLGFTTIIWGAVSGTWFGFEKIAQLPFLKSMIVDKINTFVEGNQSFMMQICFLIGAVHLTIAHSTVALRIINSLKALAQLGWILIIWSIFFMAGKLVLGKGLPGHVGIMFTIGLGLVLLFSSPQRNILKGIAVTLRDLPLKVISSFSDIISYLRLFAVGYASVAVASSFNNIALMIGFNNILRSLISAMIIVLGHGLNIILGLMAVIVHGIRLNMLEFSTHLDMQWSGIEYRPFRE
ncbi:MAG: V-type ATP synthase subunit I, partial [Candidatus Omnitrophica bacterium]|nr:V-type ATP synthase subunit I [Candidatus Omnitrophota bacterium]